jgi:hypothetical protein
MRVCSADPEGADSCAARRPIGFPIPKCAVHIEGAVCEINCRVGFVEVESRGNLFVLERKRGLDESGNAGCCVQMTDIPFYRADGAELLLTGVRAVGALQPCNFYRVANLRSRPVRFHIAD